MTDRRATPTRARSFLFVPGHRPERFARAVQSGADQIVIDLEDAVGPADKDQARAWVIDWFAAGGTAIVRVNAVESPWFAQDLAALSTTDAVIMLPKADLAALDALLGILPDREVIALVETPRGIADLPVLSARSGVVRLAFGHLDFCAEAGLPTASPALLVVRSQLMLASALAGLPAPIDGVTLELDDEAQIAADTAISRSLGFGAKLCIHPRQVAPVNTGFQPDAAELDRARRVIAAIEASGGAAVQVDGKMVDLPMIKRAEALLAL